MMVMYKVRRFDIEILLKKVCIHVESQSWGHSTARELSLLEKIF
jgi:hypothetical protein